MKMTKSRVESNVHLLTANTPSTRVQCHRMPNSSHSSLTNTFLKKGGALPSVLPVDDCIVESPCKPKHPSLTRKRNSLIIKKGNREDSERQPPHYVSHYGSLSIAGLSHTKLLGLTLLFFFQTCQLEKKMEHLSNKLSKVQDILESHLIDDAEPAEPISSSATQDEDGSFSARDYTSLLLEMNGNVASLAYDPSEFSEKTVKY